MENKANIVPPASTAANHTGGWRTYIPRTDYAKCVGCGNCARVCPESAVKMIAKDGKSKPTTDLNYCKGCGVCATECPVKTITMEVESK